MVLAPGTLRSHVKNIQKGLHWWSSGFDTVSSIPGQGNWSHVLQLKIPHVATKTKQSQKKRIYEINRTVKMRNMHCISIGLSHFLKN